MQSEVLSTSAIDNTWLGQVFRAHSAAVSSGFSLRLAATRQLPPKKPEPS